MVLLKDAANPLHDVAKIEHSQIMAGNAKQDILDALQKWGFFYIVNIPDFDALKEMETMKTFFGHPQEVKERFASNKNNPANSNVLRGYGYTKNNEGQPIEEVFNIGQYENRSVGISDVSCKAEYISREPNLWPSTVEGSEEFRKFLSQGFQMRIQVARKIVEEIAGVLGYREFVEKFTEAEFTSFYLKKYTARNEKDNVMIYKSDSGYSMKSEDGRDLSIPSHVDTTITLLATYSNGGLQALYKDAWYDVPSAMGSLLMMSGELIENLSDGKLPSLRHRVIDIKSDRYSTPFFFNPSFHADIATSMSGRKTKAGKEDWTTFGPWQVIQLHRDEPLLLNPGSLY
uniref:Putative isopenicillin-n-synthase n=1 Tax=Ctenophora sp. T WRF-2014 TaxID=1567052 RepID=A0A0A0RX60_9METZ|nr:putative isopenicillin-n-synthase [Ctenophora sp. T WRF-2014]